VRLLLLLPEINICTDGTTTQTLTATAAGGDVLGMMLKRLVTPSPTQVGVEMQRITLKLLTELVPL
jgi:hypothetical protein